MATVGIYGFACASTASPTISAVAAAIARVDFTGDFGHETGMLRIRTGAAGLIARIDANLD